MTRFRKNIAALASLALFMVSLILPALEFGSHEPVRGIITLCWGWWGLLTLDFPWLANPIYFAALFFALIDKKVISQFLSGLAFGIGLLSLRVRAWWFNEASAMPIQNLGPAFYFWMASFLVLFLLLFFKPKPPGSIKDGAEA
jgi:hypothetical protein